MMQLNHEELHDKVEDMNELLANLNETITSLREQNALLKTQINTLFEKLDKPEAKLKNAKEQLTKNPPGYKAWMRCKTCKLKSLRRRVDMPLLGQTVTSYCPNCMENKEKTIISYY